MFLDETAPNGAFDDEDSELLWETCCREYPNDPWSAWSAFSKLSEANIPPTIPACSRAQGMAVAGDSEKGS